MSINTTAKKTDDSNLGLYSVCKNIIYTA